MVNYSIIIPHHNSENVLRRCLSSIPERDDIQVIVVDDNSDPTKIDFEHFPGLGRKNVEIVLDKAGGGAGHARNIGLERAIGKWLFFVDADDYVVPEGFSILDEYQDSDADIVYFCTDSIYDDTGERAMRHITYNELVIRSHSNQSQDSYDKLRFGFVSPWGRLIKRAIAQQVKFDEVRCANDVMFSVKTAALAKNIITDIRPIYMITVSKGTLTNVATGENYLTRFEVNLRRNVFLRSIGKGRYQRSIMLLYVKLAKSGRKYFLNANVLMAKYRANPFVGCSHWINTYFCTRKMNRDMSKYKAH